MNNITISKKPLIEILSVDEQQDRLDIPFYEPELIKIFHEIEGLDDLRDLGSLIDPEAPIASGATPSGANYEEAGVPFFRVQNVRPMSIEMADTVFISHQIHNEMKRSQVKRNDVLLTITGSFGFSAVFDSVEYEEININQHIVRLRVKTEEILPEYLALFLNSKHGYGQSRRKATGGSRGALDFKAIASIKVPTPDLRSQKDIIDCFNELRKLHKKNADLIARLGDSNDSILKSGFDQILNLGDSTTKERLIQKLHSANASLLDSLGTLK